MAKTNQEKRENSLRRGFTKTLLRGAFLSSIIAINALAGPLNNLTQNDSGLSPEAMDAPQTVLATGNPHQAHMSDQTKDVLGSLIAENITDWAQSNVTVLSNQDIQGLETSEAITDKIGAMLQESGIKEKMNETDYQDLLENAQESLSKHGGAAIQLGLYDQSLQNECLILAPHGALVDPIQSFQKHSKIPTEHLENIKGGVQEHMIKIMAHEAFHCRWDNESHRIESNGIEIENATIAGIQKNYIDTFNHSLRIQEEFGAEQFSIDTMQELIKQGYENLEGIPGQTKLSRITSSFISGIYDEHSVSDKLSLDHNHNHDAQISHGDNYKTIQGFTESIAKTTSNHLNATQMHFALTKTVEKKFNEIYKNEGNIPNYDELEEALDNIEGDLFRADMNGDMNIETLSSIKDNLFEKFPETRTFFEKEMMERTARIEIQNNPSGFINKLETMLKDGSIDNKPLVKEYTKEMLKGLKEVVKPVQKQENNIKVAKKKSPLQPSL